MKVLHLVDTFEPKYERDQIQMVKMCQRNGIDTTVISSTFDSDGNLKSKAYFGQWDEPLNPVKVIRPVSFKLKLPHFNPLLIYLPHPKLFADYDLIHIYTMGSYCFFLGNLIKRIKRTKVVIRAEMSLDWHKRITKSWIWQKTLLKLLKTADAVYAFTQAEKERLLNLGISEDKVFVVPVSVDYDRFSRIQKENGEFTIGYLGRFVPVKGSHRLVHPLSKLAQEFPAVRIIFAGPKTVPDYAESVINPMTRLPNFEYLGAIPADEFYRLVDILVVPSLAETGSVTTLEAMACGKAAITSNISPMNEYIEHGVSGLLVEEDEQFYHYCKQLIQNPALAERLGKNAQEKAKQYDGQEVFHRLEIIYSSLSSKRKMKGERQSE